MWQMVVAQMKAHRRMGEHTHIRRHNLTQHDRLAIAVDMLFGCTVKRYDDARVVVVIDTQSPMFRDCLFMARCPTNEPISASEPCIT